MITLILADDDPIILQGLSMIISQRDHLKVLATATDGREAIRLCRELKPNVALLDIRMPDMDGIDAAEILLKEKLADPLLLTTFDEPELISRALRIGAKGYILKNSPADRILSAIETVAEGGSVFAPDVVDYIRTVLRVPESEASGEAGEADRFKDLTPREREITALVAEGLSNAKIADKLFLSNGTVRNHISTILEKTGLEHRTQIAVAFYLGNTN
jgi:DNA-binding NarL/FixJ family response regulator